MLRAGEGARPNSAIKATFASGCRGEFENPALQSSREYTPERLAGIQLFGFSVHSPHTRERESHAEPSIPDTGLAPRKIAENPDITSPVCGCSKLQIAHRMLPHQGFSPWSGKWDCTRTTTARIPSRESGAA